MMGRFENVFVESKDTSSHLHHDSMLIELRTYLRGLPMEEFDVFLVKMQPFDHTITDFTARTRRMSGKKKEAERW